MPRSLAPEDIEERPGRSRRSALAAVGAWVLGALAAAGVLAPTEALGCRRRTGATDSDPNDSAGFGRTGLTDSDPSDEGGCGHGRGGSGPPRGGGAPRGGGGGGGGGNRRRPRGRGCTDQDPNDRVGRGRRC
ncbi:MAG: hypothetical protein HY909_08205 [Deltaproteobacteria bacterium]|nr:hypothetical protein [Deltaproteobacteria bacterium]